MITVKNILEDDRFSNLRLINSKADLNRVVSTVESTETPDVAYYLAHNSFLITTAMVYQDNQKQLANLIVQLNDLPCAALGIKLGRFIDELDEIVIKTADELNFPLIQLPMDMTLGNIFHKLLSYLWDNENEQLLYSLNIQKRFSDLMIKNAPLSVLIRNLSNTLKRSIALVDPFGNITHTSSQIKKRESRKALRGVIESLSITRSPEIPINVALDSQLINHKKASIYPINMAGYYPYYLIIFDAYNLGYPLSNIAIEQAILILAFTLYKNLQVSYSQLSLKENFFKDLIEYTPYATIYENQLLLKGEKYGFVSSGHYQVIIASITNEKTAVNNIPLIEEWYTLAYNWLDEKLAKDVGSYVLFPDKDNFYYIILLQNPVNNIIERLVTYREVMQKTLRLDIRYYMGKVVHKISNIKSSYQEALDAMEFGVSRNDIDFIKYYNQLDAVELLSLLPKNQMENYVREVLKDLAYPTDSATQDLRHTLKTYLNLNCNITDTANTMYIHRNTVKYRIDKCEEILGRSVTDPEYGLELRLCLLYTENNQKQQMTS